MDSPPEAKKLKLEPSKEEVEIPTCDEGEDGSCVASRDPDETSTFRMEKDLGITEYVSKHEGFMAVLKQRYADFIVHEIAEDGTLAKLTDFSIPDESIPEESRTKLDAVFSSAEIEQLRGLTGSTGSRVSVVLDGSSDKETRTKMHKAIREHFSSLDSSTVDSKAIEVLPKRNQRGGRTRWPPNRGNYCKFVLFKENRDTLDAVNCIAKFFKMKPTGFQFAGTKDRRAVTSQFITAFRVRAERLKAVNDSALGNNVQLGNFRYVSDPLRLGCLFGNRFTVVLRNVSCDDHVISEALESLKDVGFINYFGTQRFGTSTIGSHHIGRCLMNSDWQEAIDLILKPRPGEREDVAAARRYYHDTRDAAGALSQMPRRRSLEATLLQGLVNVGHRNDLLGALNHITPKMRTLYVHSYQSFIWNKMASWRAREHGLSPILGDLVSKDVKTSASASVEYVTEENRTAWTIHDVLLPTPGYDIKLPNNGACEQYHKLLKEDGFSLEQFRHKVRDYSLPGSYRKLLVKPKDLQWEMFRYSDVMLPLTVSDVEALSHRPQPISIPGGSKKALKLVFSLSSAVYATMAVRELLKLDTSPRFQSQLNASEPESDVPTTKLM